ncbi:MAG: PorT family protein [Bacteroidales bacterium]|nr:PorT family protein [Bacteroidales bacterium]
MKSTLSKYKKSIVAALLLICLLPQSAIAQRKGPSNLPNYDNQPYHFGFILGFNQMSFNVDYIKDYQTIAYSSDQSNNSWDENWHDGYTYYVAGVASVPSPGFSVGIVGNLRLGKYFDLRLTPTLSFGRRDLQYYMYSDSLVNSPKTDNGFYLIKSTNAMWDAVIIELPLNVKYKSKRFNNFAAYVIGGANFRFDATGRKNTNKSDENQIIKVKTKLFDIAAEIGAGVDFYNSYFKFGIELKMGWGLLNVLDKENQILDSSFDRLRNNTFQISLTFE